MRRATWLLVPVAIAGLLAACGGGEESLAVGDTAPGFSLSDTTGTTVSLSEYANGKPVLLYFHMAVG